MDDKEITELLENIPPEERAAAWEAYVRDEVNALLDTFLPESIHGNVGIKYEHPVIKVDPRSGKPVYDDKKALAVLISIMFEFAAPVEFFGENKPEETE